MNARLSTVQTLSGDIGAGALIVNDYRIDIEEIENGHRLTITRGSEVQTMDLMDGPQGVQGPQGKKGDTGPAGPQGPQGEPGQDAPQDVVRYAVQSLGAEQQMQARENIGAADAETVNGLKDDLAAITPDDSAVDGKPWTSEKIVDTLCPSFEVSGSAVTCHPVEHYPLGAVSRIEPIQSGSGDPSPDNIRPIVGWDIVSVTRCGKNLIDYSKMVDTTSNGVKYLKQPDGGISVTGTAIKESWCQPLYNTSTAIPAGVYTTSLIGEKNTSLQVVIKRASGNNQWVSGTFVIADGDILLYTYIRVEGGKTCNETVYPMLVEGNIAPTAYEPYTGDTYTAELPETIYGGELDWNTGVLTVTHGQIASYAGETLPGEWISDRDVYAPDATPTTGAQVAYKLAEPYTVQLTPHQIVALSGVNTLYTDAGTLTVTGREDPQHTITELKNAILSLGGNI